MLGSTDWVTRKYSVFTGFVSVASEFAMAKVSKTRARKSASIERTIVRDGEAEAELLFEPVLSEVARLLWPEKTAANIASEAGCSVRAAEFYLAGQRDWSGDALASIVIEILKRHKLRNIKIGARP